MTNEEKQLLLKDLCARLPYGVKTCTYIPHIGGGGETIERTLNSITIENLEEISLYPDEKPYLRPMSSMTEEEKRAYKALSRIHDRYLQYDCSAYIDWLNKHHFDYRDLIEKGLALEAPEGMYKTE